MLGMYAPPAVHDPQMTSTKQNSIMKEYNHIERTNGQRAEQRNTNISLTCDLRNPLRGHIGLVEKYSAEMVLIGKDPRLFRQKCAAAVH